MSGDDIERLLQQSLDAIHRQNTRRGITCPDCGITFLLARDWWRHSHPSVGKCRG